ncbi:dCTP deaminase domain-containing protein [Fibrella forsythiae]|uniref:Deoxycytidine triphosphate deaminase n=1 Tax=Fibrella forsythiae TaxID=2817061 RepID=A0ABS3JST8_9BACT|nr:hypothetical protein [Fibrella forsythiae]MBO0953077.1 hypothetical protein [Fibrella forsythiae]
MAFSDNDDIRLISSENISPFRYERIKNACYELSLGEEYFITNNTDSTVKIISPPGKQLEIKAGQFALLITEEKVTIPKDKLAFISIKAGVKFRGLINVSGFHVDPGFTGRLKFSVYNAGPRSIVLEKGEPYFPIWFCDLKSPLSNDESYNGSHQRQNSINGDDIMRIQGDLASPSDILDKIKVLSKETDNNIKQVDTELSNKIRDLERKVLNLDWLKRIIIVILITGVSGFLIKYLFNDKLSPSKEEKVLVDEKVIQSLINRKVDSIFAAKQKNIVVPKK